MLPMMNFMLYAQTLFFTDNFSSDNGDWYINTNSSAYLNIENGFYYFESLEDGIYDSWRAFELDGSMNYSISADAIHATGIDNYGYGLYFAGESANNNFMFLITSNGYYCIGGTEKGDWFDIIDWQLSDAIKKGDFKSNKLTIKQSKGRWKFYINGKLVDEIQQRKYYGDKFGFSVQNYQAVLYDNYTVYTGIDNELSVTETPVGSFTEQLNKLLSDYKNNFGSTAGSMMVDSVTREAKYKCLLQMPGVQSQYFSLGVLNENFNYNAVIAQNISLKDALKIFDRYEKEISAYPFKAGKMLQNKVVDDTKEAAVPRLSDWTLDANDPAVDFAAASSMILTLNVIRQTTKKSAYNVELSIWRAN